MSLRLHPTSVDPAWAKGADVSPAAVLLDLSVWSQTLPSVKRTTLQHSALTQDPCLPPFLPPASPPSYPAQVPCHRMRL